MTKVAGKLKIISAIGFFQFSVSMLHYALIMIRSILKGVTALTA